MSLTGSRVSPAEPRTGLAGTGAGLPAWLMWRAARGLLLCLLGSAVLFLLVQALPGDAASLAAGSGGPEAVARMRERMGLDVPLPRRYLSWLGGVRLPFMGHECTNSPGPAILAMLASVPILPLSIYRQGPFEHSVRFFPPLSIPGQGSRSERIEGGTLAINRALEAIIAPQPELWFWLHDRWKRR